MASPESSLVSDMTDEEFERRTLDAIQREFGLGGLARFIMTYRSGHGDYTADRHQWLAGVTIEDIERDLKANSPT
jgi:hypothetical protein